MNNNLFCKLVNSEGNTTAILQSNELWTEEQWESLNEAATKAWNLVIEKSNDGRENELQPYEREALEFGGFTEFMKTWAITEYPKELSLFEGILCYTIQDE